MKVAQILLRHLWRISDRITRNKDRPHHIPMPLLDPINHARHLVQLFRADVRAVREAKVDERVFALHVLLREGVAVVVDQGKGTADEWSAHAFAVLCYALAVHAIFFVAEVDD